MARERYLVNAGEETINQGEIKLETKKDKRANFWYYYKWHIILSILGAILVFSIVYSIVSKVKPDYQVALMTQVAYPEAVCDQLADTFEQYAEDRNGDGQVVVQINNYQFIQGEAAENADPNVVMAGVVKFTADAQMGDSMIYITDKASFDTVTEQGNGFFVYLDDWTTPPDEGATDLDRVKIPWNDCAALASMELNYETESMTQDELRSMLFDDLSISLRSIEYGSFEEDEDMVAYYADSKALLSRVVAGE